MLLRSDMSRQYPLTSMFLSDCSMHNQNRAAAAGRDVWCCVLELNAWRRRRQDPPLAAGFQAVEAGAHVRPDGPVYRVRVATEGNAPVPSQARAELGHDVRR